MSDFIAGILIRNHAVVCDLRFAVGRCAPPTNNGCLRTYPCMCCALLVDRSHPWIQRTSHVYHSHPSGTHTSIVSYCWSHGPTSTSATHSRTGGRLVGRIQKLPSHSDVALALTFKYRSCIQISLSHSGVALAFKYRSRSRSCIQMLQLH